MAGIEDEQGRAWRGGVGIDAIALEDIRARVGEDRERQGKARVHRGVHLATMPADREQRGAKRGQVRGGIAERGQARVVDRRTEQQQSILQVITLVLVAVGVSLTLAHALELPGKMRLGKEDYVAVQSIYYPGFTIGAFFGEFGAIIAALVLLIATPSNTLAQMLTFMALIALLLMHALYWMLTHAVNKFWVADQKLGKAGAAFFNPSGERAGEDWTRLRNRWEYSHVARACCAMVALEIGRASC